MLCKQFLPTNSSEKYELVGIFVVFGSENMCYVDLIVGLIPTER